jgi:glycosyltransferase involved in cell wall biosynthesis
MERPGVIRVVSYPEDDRNPYFALFYRALEPYGVTVSYTNAIDDRMLRQPGRPFDVLHFHWGLEHIWRWRKRGRLWEIMSLVGWARFLRLAKRKGVRIVWTAHELFPPEAGRWFDLLGYAMCAHAADLCICHSGHVRNLLVRRFGVGARKVVTIPIGTYFDTVPAPAGRAAASAEFGVSASSRLLVCFGDLRPRKGVEVAVEATGLLGNAYELVVAGSAPTTVHQAWVRNLERSCRAAPNITVRIERLQNQVLATLLGAADCVLLPYLQIFGSSAFSLCLALGRGVVASDLPYFREVLSLEPKAGVLAKPGDPTALACAIEEFFSEPPAVRHEAARRLGQKLAWEKIIPPVGEWFATKGQRKTS